MNDYSILVIDDEEEIANLIEIYLVNEGYKVYKAKTGSEGLDILAREQLHLVILDIMMPEMDGIEVCRRIREKLNIPIIMLSAKSQDMDKILGLGIGADDYVTKPFNPMELIARIKSQIRRCMFFSNANHIEANASIINIKGLVINKDSHKVLKYDQEVSLTPTEFQILFLLASNSGKVFGAEDIFKNIWKEKYFESNNTVMAHIWRLRDKIEDDPKEPRILETVWGVGYKIEK